MPNNENGRVPGNGNAELLSIEFQPSGPFGPLRNTPELIWPVPVIARNSFGPRSIPESTCVSNSLIGGAVTCRTNAAWTSEYNNRFGEPWPRSWTRSGVARFLITPCNTAGVTFGCV